MEPHEKSESFDDAFESLFLIAYRSAFRLLGSRQDAEDAAIDTLTRASANWRRIQMHPAPWVTTVSANIAIDVWRRRKRRPVPEVTYSADPFDNRRLDLLRALDALPRRQRDTVVLRYFEDLTEAQTATALGISPGSVKQHTSRAMASLKRVLGEP